MGRGAAGGRRRRRRRGGRRRGRRGRRGRRRRRRRRRHRRRRQTGAGADDFAEGAGVLAADQAQQPTGAAAHRTGAAGAAQITCRFIRTMFNQVK